jgi:kynurenine formamidase
MRSDPRRFALSYPLGPSTPIPNGGIPVRIEATSRVSKGDISDTSLVRLWNHSGTHVDGPAHVLAGKGPFSEWMPACGLEFTKVSIIDLPPRESPMNTADDLSPSVSQSSQAELLLLRTGFWHYRASDPRRYQHDNPGFAVSAAEWVLEHCRAVQCIGIDSISFACARHVPEGIEAHRILLGRVPPVLLLEDINLDFDFSRLRRVTIVPFMIDGLDSCPCSVIAERD